MSDAPHRAPEAIEALAEALLDAIGRNDPEVLRAEVLAADASVWTNNVGRDLDVDAYLGTVRWLHGRATDVRFDVVARHLTDGGYVQRHVLRGTTGAGEELAVPACLVVEVSGERITRVDEYLDSAHLAPLVRG